MICTRIEDVYEVNLPQGVRQLLGGRGDTEGDGIELTDAELAGRAALLRRVAPKGESRHELAQAGLSGSTPLFCQQLFPSHWGLFSWKLSGNHTKFLCSQICGKIVTGGETFRPPRHTDTTTQLPLSYHSVPVH